MNEETLRVRLADIPLGGLKFFEATGSTNDAAMTWAEQGAPDFSLVVADSQTAGRGRFQRRWVTNPGTALAFSLLLRPTPAEMGNMGMFSALGAMAVCDALERLGLTGQIKWPNDVLLQERKVCGILSEAVWLGNQLQAVILGIGVNVAPGSVPPPEEVIFPAVCVEEVLGQAVERADLLREILQALTQRRKALVSPGFVKAWEARLAFRGKQVRLSKTGDDGLIGVVDGIEPDGSLRLLGHDGKINIVAVGEIHLRPA
jgi:BirA family biotin operon repressor/biotin-[acetyl-CoA-carboxylase] ligase